jgi:hypothetical protein
LSFVLRALNFGNKAKVQRSKLQRFKHDVQELLLC